MYHHILVKEPAVSLPTSLLGIIIHNEGNPRHFVEVTLLMNLLDPHTIYTEYLLETNFIVDYIIKAGKKIIIVSELVQQTSIVNDGKIEYLLDTKTGDPVSGIHHVGHIFPYLKSRQTTKI